MAVVPFILIFADTVFSLSLRTTQSFKVVSVLKMAVSPKFPPHLPQNQNLVNLLTLTMDVFSRSNSPDKPISTFEVHFGSLFEGMELQKQSLMN